MNEREQLCKEFTELTGGHWHEDQKPEYCDGKLGGRCKIMRDSNPTYENPADVLRVIYDNFGDAELQSFLCWTGYYNQQDDYDLDWIKDNLFEPDTLLKKAIEFLIEMEKWK